MCEPMISVSLPWPARVLFPNAHIGRNDYAVAAQRARVTAQNAAVTAGLNRVNLPEAGDIELNVTFYFPDEHLRDSDGLVSSCKPYRDGICDVLRINDARLWPASAHKAAVVPNGLVVFSLGGSNDA